MWFTMHLSNSSDGDLRTEKALEEEFWKWIVLANGCFGHPLREAAETLVNQKLF